MAHDRVGRQSVEVVEEVLELGGAHALAHRRRAANVREQQGHRQLDPGHPVVPELRLALHAHGGVAGRSAEAGGLEHDTANPTEGSGAQLAAG